MNHLKLAYDLFVILIGFSALFLTVFWRLKTQETYLKDFCVLYALFTSVLIVSVLKDYLYLNLNLSSVTTGFILSGIKQALNIFIIIAAVKFLLVFYQNNSAKIILSFFLILSIISIVLMISPFGSTLNPEQNSIDLGPGYKIAAGWYFLAFSFVIIFGYYNLIKMHKNNRKIFIFAVLLFASVGYIETIISLINSLLAHQVSITNQSGFLFSSIPYALYGIFLVYYFLNYTHQPSGIKQIPQTILNQYTITEREHEVIRKVLEGKSNAEIGDELFISLATVKTHLHNIYKKTGVNNRFELLTMIQNRINQ